MICSVVSCPRLCPVRCISSRHRTQIPLTRRRPLITRHCTSEETTTQSVVGEEIACIGTGTEVECLIEESSTALTVQPEEEVSFLQQLTNTCVLISPFFFWGTSMVVMKLAAPHTSPLFVGFIRLFPAGLALLAWAVLQKRPQPSTLNAWFAILLFGLIDGACFQGFLAEGLQRTTAGLGSIIIDSQPLTVALLAALFYNERFTFASSIGLGIGVLGLSCLQLPTEAFSSGLHLELQGISLWDRGEWWMLLAAQSMAVGTVMVRWVSKYCDPVMATAWHMIVGSVPLLFLCLTQESSDLALRLADFNLYDALDLTYVALLGSAASYGVFFYNASKGNLTALSSLTFLTPVFATLTGFFVLQETLTPLQLLGGFITLTAVFLINSAKQETA